MKKVEDGKPHSQPFECWKWGRRGSCGFAGVWFQIFVRCDNERGDDGREKGGLMVVV